MANATASRLGQINTSGDALALFLKVFSGEVLTAFNEKTVTLDKHLVRTIQSGKSAQFPIVGKIGAEYHTVGAEITGLQVPHNEKVITIDGLLLSHSFIANIDEAMNHYDVRGIYSRQMGQKLAEVFDTNVMKEIIKGARSSALITGGFGGTQIISDDFKSSTTSTRVGAIIDAFRTMAQKFDEKSVPDTERWAILTPEDYYLLVSNKDTINKDWSGAGSYAEGSIQKLFGISILKSNLIPRTDTTASDTYHGVNADKTRFLFFQSSGVGTVKLMDLAMESEYDIRRQGTLLVAKMAVGHGFLRPECCGEALLNTLTN